MDNCDFLPDLELGFLPSLHRGDGHHNAEHTYVSEIAFHDDSNAGHTAVHETTTTSSSPATHATVSAAAATVSSAPTRRSNRAPRTANVDGGAKNALTSKQPKFSESSAHEGHKKRAKAEDEDEDEDDDDEEDNHVQVRKEAKSQRKGGNKNHQPDPPADSQSDEEGEDEPLGKKAKKHIVRPSYKCSKCGLLKKGHQCNVQTQQLPMIVSIEGLSGLSQNDVVRLQFQAGEKEGDVARVIATPTGVKAV